jgi:hypothetical protein
MMGGAGCSASDRPRKLSHGRGKSSSDEKRRQRFADRLRAFGVVMAWWVEGLAGHVFEPGDLPPALSTEWRSSVQMKHNAQNFVTPRPGILAELSRFRRISTVLKR